MVAYPKQRSDATDWIKNAVWVLSSTLILSGAFVLADAQRVEAFPKLEKRGPRGAYHLVNESTDAESDLPTLHAEPEPESLKQSEVSPQRRFPILIPQGPHGAYRILNKPGVGGPSGGEYQGFPKLERRGPHGAYHILND